MKIKPLSAKYTETWWKNELTKSEERRKPFLDAAEESIRVYNAKKHINILNDAERRLNVWWYCTNTLLPAYYSSTPKAEVNLRKRSGGLKYELGAVILERNIQYALDQYFNFDDVGYLAALQFLLTGQAVLWARYSAKFESVVQQFSLIRSPGDGMLIDAMGQPYNGPLDDVVEEGNIVTVTQAFERKVDEKAVLELVHYPDYYCNDARSQQEIEWQARRAYLDRDQVEEKFGKDVANRLSFSSHPNASLQRSYKKDDTFEGKAELFEIWCEASGKVYWLAKGSEKPIIESSSPPIEFDKFYPCSVIAQSCDPDSVIPVSDYSHCKDQILEVERLTTRIHALTQAIRTNALYDSALGNQVQELLTGDLKLTPTNNWPSYKAKGGLNNSIEFMNIEPFVNGLTVLQNARQVALERLYETLKVSDLLRGTSDQYKSATANRLENQWSSLGLIVRQNMFTKFVSDAIQNLGAIIASQFDEERLMEIGDAERLIAESLYKPEMPMPAEQAELTGFEAMGQPEGGEAPPMPMLPAPQASSVPTEMDIKMVEDEIIEVFRDTKERCYRIQIASDSMVAIDQAQQQSEGAALLQAAGGFFEQMRSVIEQYPPLLDFSIALFQNMIRRFKGGKELDGIFTKALQQVGEIAKAKEEAAKQPPPPDPTMIEMQARMQIAQIESQARLQAAQLEMQDKAAKNELAMQDQQLKIQKDGLEAQLAVQRQQFEEWYKSQELLLAQQEIQVKANSNQNDLIKIEASSESERVKASIAQEKTRMDSLLEMQSQELETMRIRLSEAEKLMEEKRLQNEQTLERVRVNMEAIQATPAATEVPKGKKQRRGKVNIDDLGNFSIDLED